ncbi:MAG: histidine kinase dimerization/phospho-acceptor domain-containing protein [Acutalibacteraceae bacterium]
MFKRLSTQITVLIVLILAVVMGSVSVFYIVNAKDIYVKNEINAMNEFCDKMIESDMNRSEIDALLSEYDVHSYGLRIFNSRHKRIFSNGVPFFEKEDTDSYFDKFTAKDSAKKIERKNGVERIVVKKVVFVQDETYYIHIQESLKTVDAVFSHTNRFLLVGMFLFMLVSAVSIYILLTISTKSVGELNEAAQAMASGEYSTRYSGKYSNNEIGTLSRNFNTMADTIQENINKITNYNFLLKEDMARITEYDKMRKRVLSNVTHELKTPLAIISSQMEMMTYIDDPVKKKYYYESAISEVETMSALISRLLNFSSGEKDIFEAEAEKINLSWRIKSNISKMSPILRSKNIAYSAEIEEGCHLTIVPNHVDRIFNNYIINAIHHVSAGGKIVISLKSEKSGIRLAVYNDGEPIKEEDTVKIWTDFYKNENTDSEMTAGLGLFIVKEISIIDSDLCGVNNKRNGVEFWYLFKTVKEKELSDE